MKPAIEVRHLSKTFSRGTQRSASYRTIRDHFRMLLRKGSARLEDASQFHALNNVNFEIFPGEVVGIIGRNGAGKSTLLKILSRISPPTRGQVTLRGRLASLLEVGTGFHMELTGRENVYLNGTILGMRKRDIAARFDEIVAFAGVEAFIDTPVKHYSSGMYVRLAFAVAAYLDQEIMLVDEVLAVGDAAFQERCIGRMKQMSTAEGRTVLFVSHNNASVAALCNRGIVLNQGEVAHDSDALSALAFYNQSLARGSFSFSGNLDTPRILGVRIDESALLNHVIRIHVQFHAPRPLSPPVIGVTVRTMFGSPVFGFNTRQDPTFVPVPASSGEAILEIQNPPLMTGAYKISVWLGEKNEDYDVQQDALTFDYVGRSHLPPGVSLEVVGPVAVEGTWRIGVTSDCAGHHG